MSLPGELFAGGRDVAQELEGEFWTKLVEGLDVERADRGFSSRPVTHCKQDEYAYGVEI